MGLTLRIITIKVSNTIGGYVSCDIILSCAHLRQISTIG